MIYIHIYAYKQSMNEIQSQKVKRTVCSALAQDTWAGAISRAWWPPIIL